ncbi:hypothetical protein F4811DRAFT_503739 [Daldinia bambusicola]|nr:hypothetical protein F4811DRAFT_503739 [Daldinia bambusicola]
MQMYEVASRFFFLSFLIILMRIMCCIVSAPPFCARATCLHKYIICNLANLATMHNRVVQSERKTIILCASSLLFRGLDDR